MSWDSIPLTLILRQLRAIFRYPDIALLVQHISFLSSHEKVQDNYWDRGEVRDEDCWKVQIAQFPDVVESAIGLIRKAKFPEDEAAKWTTAIKDGDPYALVAILLSQLHNLETLRLDYTFVWQSGFPGLMLKHALFSAPEGTMSNFNHLILVDYGSNIPVPKWEQDIWYEEGEEGYPICDPNQFMAWFHLPSVQSISIWLQSLQGAIISEKQLKQVTSLVLARSSFTHREVYSLLQSTPNLQALHMGIAFQDFSLLENPYVIRDALKLVSHTVETLSICLTRYPYDTHNYDNDEETEARDRDVFRGFLKVFPKLRVVEVPVTVLLSLLPENAPNIRTVLPNTLEELCLQLDIRDIQWHFWNSEQELLGLVGDMLRDLRSHSPALKRIVLRIEDSDSYPLDTVINERQGIQTLCELAGVDLQVIYDSLSPGLWSQIDHSM